MSGSRSLISLIPPLATAGLIDEGGAAYAPPFSVFSERPKFTGKSPVQWRPFIFFIARSLEVDSDAAFRVFAADFWSLWNAP
jgi:hypothetical protein